MGRHRKDDTVIDRGLAQDLAQIRLVGVFSTSFGGSQSKVAFLMILFGGEMSRVAAAVFSHLT